MATKVASDDVKQDVARVWREYKDDPTNQDLRNRLVERYLPLVKYNGERIWARLPEGVELDDLISAGVFGLMDAIDAFDLSRGVKFETYCVPRIRGAMLDELRTMDWVRIPFNYDRRDSRYQRYSGSLSIDQRIRFHEWKYWLG